MTWAVLFGFSDAQVGLLIPVTADDINCGMIGSVGPVEFCDGGSDDGGGDDDGSGGGDDDGNGGGDSGGDTGGGDGTGGGGDDTGGDTGNGGGSGDSDTSSTTTGGGGGGSYGGGGYPTGQVLGTSVVPLGIACDKYLTSFIKPDGDNDVTQVYRLQALLKTFEGADLEMSGVYDEASIAAVHAFQTKYTDQVLAPWGISDSTGFVYLTTRKKMNEVYCQNTQQFPLTVEEENIIEKAKLPAAVAALVEPTPEAEATDAEKEAEKTEVTKEEKKSSPVVKTKTDSFTDFFQRLFDRFR